MTNKRGKKRGTETPAASVKKHVAIIGLLWLAVMVSGLSVIYSTHLSRKLTNELEGMHRVSSGLHVEWSQYLLEYSTWAAYSHVEEEAQDKLHMTIPGSDKVVVVQK